MPKARIGFPTKCRYRGGKRALGSRGRHLWIKDGRLGHDWLWLSHSIPIESVERIEVVERVVQADKVSGIQGRRIRKSVDTVFTDIAVHTTDGQTALWVVEGKSADWVRAKLGSALAQYRISLG